MKGVHYMLKVQEFLHNTKNNPSADTNFDLLKEHFGIKSNFHPTLPLVILSYDQIESPKMEPIVRECRGLVLHTETYEIVAGCMPRFFNMGEALEITGKFDWESHLNARVKEDGSLMSLYHFNGTWMVKTRGSWADQAIGENMPRWDELFFSLLPKGFLKVCQPDLTYVFEMCSMYNQVVRQYPEPKLFLLTVIYSETNNEFSATAADLIAKKRGLNRPEKLDITNPEAVKQYIIQLEQTDGTAEGLVLQDVTGLRIKCKSATYLAYSRLGNNGNIATDRNLIPLIMAGEDEEAVAIFPAIKPRVEQLSAWLNANFAGLTMVWEQCKDIEDQKEFALMITKQFKTPFSGILFKMKKAGTISNHNVLRLEWHQSEALILKVLEG
jgi:hypothetical protein